MYIAYRQTVAHIPGKQTSKQYTPKRKGHRGVVLQPSVSRQSRDSSRRSSEATKKSVRAINWYRISEVRGVIFATPPFEGSYSGGELFFHLIIFSLLTKRNSDQIVAKLCFLGRRTRPIVYTMSSPGSLIEGGSYFFDVSAIGRRELIKRGSFSRGS